jgi:hypothetical protein
VCEQAHQQMKEELGLDHFEGRSWHGLHHHALMVMVAMAFLQHLRLAEHRRTRPGENAPPRSGSATIAEPARRAGRSHHSDDKATNSPNQVPALPPQTAIARVIPSPAEADSRGGFPDAAAM